MAPCRAWCAVIPCVLILARIADNVPVGRIANLRASSIAATIALLFLTGCGEKKHTRARVQPAPEIAPPRSTAAPATSTSSPSISAIPPNAPAIFTEIGIASWYGPPYHNRKAANGEIFDMNQLTAAHKTLPLNSVARITNLANNRSVTVRINDRGPFVGDRMVDLSLAAAREIGVWRTGLARVKLEVLQSPSPIDQGGRWCVQIGAFQSLDDALKLKSRLQRKYHTAQVIQFTGPTGQWVRIRPLNDDHGRALEVMKDIHVSEGGVFLVRLD